MFTSSEQTKSLTGFDVTPDILSMAQGIIEAYVGRTEADVDDASDLANLGKATAYQAAYLANNSAIVFEQMRVSQIGQFGQVVTFRADDPYSPYLAPLAVIACKNLTWLRTRSVHTGRMHSGPAYLPTWETT